MLVTLVKAAISAVQSDRRAMVVAAMPAAAMATHMDLRHQFSALGVQKQEQVGSSSAVAASTNDLNILFNCVQVA